MNPFNQIPWHHVLNCLADWIEREKKLSAPLTWRDALDIIRFLRQHIG